MKRAPILKSREQLRLMREAGRVAHLALRAACEAVRPGVTTAEVDAVTEETIRRHGATPEFKGYQGFPAATCISINHEVVHGIPGTRRIQEGDLVSIDVGARLAGHVGDNAASVLAGEGSPAARDLSETTRECLEAAARECRVGRNLSDVSRAIQHLAECRGFNVIRDYMGHGIGSRMHEDPQVPNYVDAGTLRHDLILEKGLCLAIEPMLSVGSAAVRVLEDRWTVVTSDGSLAAHWEDVVAVTGNGPVVLTRP